MTDLKTNRFVLFKFPFFFRGIYYRSESGCWDNPTLEIFQWFYQTAICILRGLTYSTAVEILCTVICGSIWLFRYMGRGKDGFKWLLHFIA